MPAAAEGALATANHILLWYLLDQRASHLAGYVSHHYLTAITSSPGGNRDYHAVWMSGDTLTKRWKAMIPRSDPENQCTQGGSTAS